MISGEDIPIEERNPDEIRSLWFKEPVTPAGIWVENPAFDVTTGDLITGIITDRGLIHPPFENQLILCK